MVSLLERMPFGGHATDIGIIGMTEGVGEFLPPARPTVMRLPGRITLAGGA